MKHLLSLSSVFSDYCGVAGFMLHVPILSRIRFTSVTVTVTAVTRVAANLATLWLKCCITPFREHDFTDALIDSQWGAGGGGVNDAC